MVLRDQIEMFMQNVRPVDASDPRELLSISWEQAFMSMTAMSDQEVYLSTLLASYTESFYQDCILMEVDVHLGAITTYWVLVKSSRSR